MAMVSSREVNKEFQLAMKHFRTGIKLAKENLIVGEVTLPGKMVNKTVRKPRIKKITPLDFSITSPGNTVILPD